MKQLAVGASAFQLWKSDTGSGTAEAVTLQPLQQQGREIEQPPALAQRAINQSTVGAQRCKEPRAQLAAASATPVTSTQLPAVSFTPTCLPQRSATQPTHQRVSPAMAMTPAMQYVSFPLLSSSWFLPVQPWQLPRAPPAASPLGVITWPTQVTAADRAETSRSSVSGSCMGPMISQVQSEVTAQWVGMFVKLPVELRIQCMLQMLDNCTTEELTQLTAVLMKRVRSSTGPSTCYAPSAYSGKRIAAELAQQPHTG